MLRIGMNPAAQATPPTAPPQGDAPAGGPPPELLAALAAQQGGADAPPQDPTADPTTDPSRKSKQMYQADKVPQQYAGYKEPDKGPFKCSNCDFFDKAGLCHIVAGKIDPEGFCNNFLSINEPLDPEEQDNEAAEGASDTPEEETAEAPPEGAPSEQPNQLG